MTDAELILALRQRGFTDCADAIEAGQQLEPRKDAGRAVLAKVAEVLGDLRTPHAYRVDKAYRLATQAEQPAGALDFRANVRKWAVYCFQKHGDDAHLYNGLAELAGMEPWGSVPRCPDCGLVTTASFHLCAGPLKPLAGSVACKYGDPSCPCQDGDPCHYEDTATTKAMAPPPPAEAREERTPNADEVICPGCTHQFRAVPENVQAELAALRAQVQTLTEKLNKARSRVFYLEDRFAVLEVQRDEAWQQAKAALIAAVQGCPSAQGHPRLVWRDVVRVVLRAVTPPQE